MGIDVRGMNRRDIAEMEQWEKRMRDQGIRHFNPVDREQYTQAQERYSMIVNSATLEQVLAVYPFTANLDKESSIQSDARWIAQIIKSRSGYYSNILIRATIYGFTDGTCLKISEGDAFVTVK